MAALLFFSHAFTEQPLTPVTRYENYKRGLSAVVLAYLGAFNNLCTAILSRWRFYLLPHMEELYSPTFTNCPTHSYASVLHLQPTLPDDARQLLKVL